MTSRISSIAIDAVELDPIAEFWCEVLGWTVLERDEDIISIGPTDGAWPGLDILKVPETKTIKNRLHFDLRADGSSTAEELERLLGLGARRVRHRTGRGRQLGGAGRPRRQRVLLALAHGGRSPGRGLSRARAIVPVLEP